MFVLSDGLDLNVSVGSGRARENRTTKTPALDRKVPVTQTLSFCQMHFLSPLPVAFDRKLVSVWQVFHVWRARWNKKEETMKHEPQRYRVYNVGSRPQANQHFILDIFPGSCLLFVVPFSARAQGCNQVSKSKYMYPWDTWYNFLSSRCTCSPRTWSCEPVMKRCIRYCMLGTGTCDLKTWYQEYLYLK